MSRLAAIPMALFAVLCWCMVGMIAEMLMSVEHFEPRRVTPSKTFGFTLMVICSLAGTALLFGAGYVVVKGFPF